MGQFKAIEMKIDRCFMRLLVLLNKPNILLPLLQFSFLPDQEVYYRPTNSRTFVVKIELFSSFVNIVN